jgi:hypothetical protein
LTVGIMTSRALAGFGGRFGRGLGLRPKWHGGKAKQKHRGYIHGFILAVEMPA